MFDCVRKRFFLAVHSRRFCGFSSSGGDTQRVAPAVRVGGDGLWFSLYWAAGVNVCFFQFWVLAPVSGDLTMLLRRVRTATAISNVGSPPRPPQNVSATLPPVSALLKKIYIYSVQIAQYEAYWGDQLVPKFVYDEWRKHCVDVDGGRLSGPAEDDACQMLEERMDAYIGESWRVFFVPGAGHGAIDAPCVGWLVVSVLLQVPVLPQHADRIGTVVFARLFEALDWIPGVCANDASDGQRARCAPLNSWPGVGSSPSCAINRDASLRALLQQQHQQHQHKHQQRQPRTCTVGHESNSAFSRSSVFVLLFVAIRIPRDFRGRRRRDARPHLHHAHPPLVLSCLSTPQET